MQNLRLKLDVGPRLTLSQLGDHLRHLERVSVFGGEMAVLNAIYQGIREEGMIPSKILDELDLSNPHVYRDMDHWDRNADRNEYLRGRLEEPVLVAESPDPLVEWWLGVGQAAGAFRGTLEVRSLSYRNPADMVLIGGVIAAQGVLWITGQIQQFQLRRAEVRRRTSEAQKLDDEAALHRVEAFRGLHELGETLVLTEGLIRGLVPDLSDQAIQALIASSAGRGMLTSLPRVPAIQESSFERSMGSAE